MFVTLSRECYKLRLAAPMHPPTLIVKINVYAITFDKELQL